MNDILENLKQMKEDQCPFINICEGNVKCIDGRYTQGVICLSKKHIECTKIQQLQNRIMELEKENNQLKDYYNSATDRVIEFDGIIQELHKKIDVLECKKEQLEQKIKDLGYQLESIHESEDEDNDYDQRIENDPTDLD